MGRPTTLPEPWRSLADQLGGVQALADVLLCDVRTLSRWARHQTYPDRRSRWLIYAAFSKAGMEPPV